MKGGFMCGKSPQKANTAADSFLFNSQVNVNYFQGPNFEVVPYAPSRV